MPFTNIRVTSATDAAVCSARRGRSVTGRASLRPEQRVDEIGCRAVRGSRRSARDPPTAAGHRPRRRRFTRDRGTGLHSAADDRADHGRQQCRRANVATAHAKKPCAVSRKYTSSVWHPPIWFAADRRDSRPSPDAANCMNVIQRMLETPNVLASIPSVAQGDTDDSPSPVPSSNRISDSAAGRRGSREYGAPRHCAARGNDRRVVPGCADVTVTVGCGVGSTMALIQ